jgi:L-threonylcarbamoyladenylate synthase
MSARGGAASDIVRIDPDCPDEAVVERVARVLRAGGVAAFPTDTVYGLGCSGESRPALERLAVLKAGERRSPFILLVGHAGWVGGLVKVVTPLAASLMDRWWPGPLTIVLDARDGLDEAVVSPDGTVAIRLPASVWCRSLCLGVGAPVASTSANRAGEPPARGAMQAAIEFGDGVDITVDGGPPASDLPSTLVDARGGTPRTLRRGALEIGTTGR